MQVHDAPSTAIISGGKKAILALLFLFAVLAALLISSRLNDESFVMEYQSNWTRDWVKESELGTEAEIRERVERGLMMIPVEYPWPPLEVKKMKTIRFRRE